VLEKAEEAIEKVSLTEEVSDVLCDKCGRNMVVKLGRYGKFLACPGFPECRNTKAIIKEIGVSCPDCGASVIEKKTKRGKIFFGCTNYPECEFTSWDKPTDIKCPDCGGIMYEKLTRGNRKYCPVCEEKKKGDKKK